LRRSPKTAFVSRLRLNDVQKSREVKSARNRHSVVKVIRNCARYVPDLTQKHQRAVGGAAVAINYHSQREPAEQLRGEVERSGGRAIVVGGDVSNEADAALLFDRTVEAFGRVDILVANAGARKDAGIADMTLDDWREVIELDLTGQFLCCREAVWRFRAQDSADRPFRSADPSSR
jgi:NAD(P)-dependent dehydrogenase (short-subunit alcohol dehydrogenase family)